ncbi:MAG: hypothetical protein CBC24_09175 [Candidatus Pelagibacter sp. TMED64]|nr:MAG: hypothetical protein CBC24_09175 [Candidatus Pelagibacter sp. TMED64]|tara:strand:+ start:393 stop:656 length:264 start_codon:yes stop_codon:yes gene_type:complete
MTKQTLENSIDGRSYTKEVEDDLNSKAYGLFGSGIGKSFLQYLDNLTINTVRSPDTPPEQMMYFEGQRWTVAVIKARVENGKKLNNN